MARDYFAGPDGNGNWQVKGAGNKRATSKHRTQDKAWAEAKELAKANRGEALLQGRNGRIRERNTYGKDPFPPKG